MNYLQYKSSEMFSSTQLIRKSKTIFNKIESKEIEKAVILRDGKPSFIMLDFEIYEVLMNEYLKLKNEECNIIKEINKLDETNQESENIDIIDKNKDTSDNRNKENQVMNKQDKKSELLDKLDKIDGIIINDTDEKPENLKEFWE